MKKSTKQFIRGFGSVINICPSVDYDAVVPRRTPEESMQNSWKRVKTAFEKSVSEFDYEQKKENRKKR